MTLGKKKLTRTNNATEKFSGRKKHHVPLVNTIKQMGEVIGKNKPLSKGDFSA